jgi:hypothetical protein
MANRDSCGINIKCFDILFVDNYDDFESSKKKLLILFLVYHLSLCRVQGQEHRILDKDGNQMPPFFMQVDSDK